MTTSTCPTCWCWHSATSTGPSCSRRSSRSARGSRSRRHRSAARSPRRHKAIVRGYDLSHRLHRGRHTETYRNVKDSDIAQTIAQRAKLPVDKIDDSGPTYEHVSQANTSDWEFLAARAQEIGFEVSVKDGKFSFRKPT